MKKSIALLLALVLALGCALLFKDCSGLEEQDKTLTKYYDGLYKLEAAEPDYEAAEKLLAQASAFRASIGSAIVTADFAGYNFDYNEELDTYVIQTEAGAGKFAVLGVAHYDSSKGLAVASGENPEGVPAAALNALMTEGVNDHGVFVGLLTMTDAENPAADGTNPENPVKMNFLLTVRYLLERSQSAWEAVSELSQLNLYLSADEAGMGYHLLIADKEKSFVAELFDNRLVVTEDRKELTNFCISLPASTMARGLERYNYLHTNNEYIASRWGMMKTMKYVWGSQMYQWGKRWYSDYYGTYLDAEGNEVVINSESTHAEAKVFIEPLVELYGQDPTGFFKNIHSAVYDFETGTMSIIVNEKNVELQFSLNIEPPAPVEESIPDVPEESTEVPESDASGESVVPEE